MRLDVTVEEFYSDDESETNFLDRISSFLSISTDKLKIVGIVDVPKRR